MVEQLTLNQLVEGSNPPGVTNPEPNTQVLGSGFLKAYLLVTGEDPKDVLRT